MTSRSGAWNQVNERGISERSLRDCGVCSCRFCWFAFSLNEGLKGKSPTWVALPETSRWIYWDSPPQDPLTMPRDLTNASLGRVSPRENTVRIIIIIIMVSVCYIGGVTNTTVLESQWLWCGFTKPLSPSSLVPRLVFSPRGLTDAPAFLFILGNLALISAWLWQMVTGTQ